jgi:hypothetical protein
MLIGDWSEEANLQPTRYHLLINRHKIDVKQLNKHVLECTLPKFDHLYQDEQLNNSLLSNSLDNEDFDFNPNTLVYVYENNNLYCQPILFQIKISS